MLDFIEIGVTYDTQITTRVKNLLTSASTDVKRPNRKTTDTYPLKIRKSRDLLSRSDQEACRLELLTRP
mgnify:CR=1 FL=1